MLHLNGVGGSPHLTFNSGGDRGAAETAPARQISSGVNLRQVLRVGSWNILSLSEDHPLPHLLDELRRLRMDIVGLSEMRRPDSGEISNLCFTYYWSSLNNGSHLMGVAIGVSSRLKPSVVEVIPVMSV